MQATQFVAPDSHEMIFYQINCSNVGVQCDEIKPESARIVIEEEPKEKSCQIDSQMMAISPEKQFADLDKLMFSIMHGH